MTLVTTPAIILNTLRYSETSKIVRLATRDHGVQSAIAKGALRPRSRFGASLQVHCDGIAHLVLSERRELHLLTGFDLVRLRVSLTGDVGRYATAAVLAELMLRFAPAAPHPESFDVLKQGLNRLETAPPSAAELAPVALQAVWALVGALGFAPALDVCVQDGSAVPASGGLLFGTAEGGALCAGCARGREVVRLPETARQALVALVDPSAALPVLDARHAAAHRRLVARYIRHHLAENAALPALEFWQRAWG
jgi:DNA repair protein RecO (recombination protein O)